MAAKINNRSTLFKGKIFELVSENVTLENGVTTDISFLQHPGAAAMVPMYDEAHVILIKQYRHAIGKYIWEIPAGTLDPDETPLGCAQRELIEETGYSASQWQEIGQITPVPGYSSERIHIFLASDLRPAEQNLDKDEMLNVHKIKFDKAINMIRRGDIQDSKTISGLFLANAWIK
jgi:ADP-ribose pyrophosphatase